MEFNSSFSKQLYPDSLMHHGIKGMHWGIRRFEDANGHLTPAGKRRYAVQDARKYYKINRLQRAREKTDNDKVKKFLDGEIRRTKTRSDRKQALLSKKDIDVGREIVAKHRLNWAGANTAAKAALTAAGAYALYKNPETRALAPLALAGGAALTYGSAKKIPYYFMENRRYKQGNEKGATKKGLTKKQQALRTAGKVAAGAALAGVAGYALYKSGAGEAAINAGKNALETRTGIKFGKKPSVDSGKNSTHDDTEHIPRSQYAKMPSGDSSKNSTHDDTEHIPRSQYAKLPSVHNASEQIRAANRAASEEFRKRAAASKKESDRQVASEKRKKAVKNAASSVGSAAKEKARSAVRKKVMDGVDESDPRTWVNAARNAKDTASNLRRYGRAINKMRKGNAVGAAAEISDELTDTANKFIEGSQSMIDKARSARDRRKK